MLFAVMLAASPSGLSLATIDTMLDAALDHDRRAYVQICGISHRLAKFKNAQARAEVLNEEFGKIKDSSVISIRNIDRRPVGACRNSERFERTVADWNAALDKIQFALNGAQR